MWTCLGCCFQFHLEAEDIWSKDEREVTLSKRHFAMSSIHTAKSWKGIKWEEKGGCFVTVISAL